MSTPLMGLTLPTDHGSVDTWDVILGVVFGLIDGHDHTTGKGAQVPSAALKINADVSWASAGVSRSITDLKAIDFAPSASTAVSSLAAALFVSDGTGGLSANELYWRTTTGSNVKMTSGAALNVAAFVGGIGGDYSAVAALVDFDDASDSYRFRQQVGTGVRQFARMQGADVDLFEFKASPAAGVPTNRVRLASPAALAASYTLTMPAGLPARTAPLRSSSSGAVTATPDEIPFPPGLALPTAADSGVFAGHAWNIGPNTVLGMNCPIPLPVGSQFPTWKVLLQKVSSNAFSISAKLFELNMLTGAVTQIGPTQSTSANNPFNTSLTGAGTTVLADRCYYLLVFGNASGTDELRGWSVSV